MAICDKKVTYFDSFGVKLKSFSLEKFQKLLLLSALETDLQIADSILTF